MVAPPPPPAQQQQQEGGFPVCDYTKQALCSARSLLLSAEVHRVVADNLLRTSGGLLGQGDYEMVSEFAWMGFKEINAGLGVQAPAVASELEQVQLRREQQHAVLDVLALLSDPAVQALGFDVAKVIRTSTFATRKYLKFGIEGSLEPVDEIQEMARGFIPESVLAAWRRGGYDWEMTLDPRNIRSMRTDKVGLGADGSSADFKAKSHAVYAGVLQEGRVLLEVLKIYVHARGPSWATNMHDVVEPLLSGAALPEDSARLAFVETFLWPMKCAAQGIDALRASVGPEFGREFEQHRRGGAGGGGAEDLDAIQAAARRERGHRLSDASEGLGRLRSEFTS